MSVHPDDHQLLAWLDEATPSLTDHVEQCEVCATHLDALVAAEVTTLDVDLAEAFPVDDGLESRLLARVSSDLDRRAAAETFLSLFGIAVETAQIVLGEENDR